MYMKYIHLFVITLFLLSSCSEDTTSTNSSTNGGKPFLEALPTSVQVHEYEYFELKYRVSNFSHEDQVRLTVNLGNGDTLPEVFPAYRSIYGYYSEAGKYTLTLSAYDTFSDTLLATKSIPVTVDPFQVTTSLSPANLDTSISASHLIYPILFIVSVNVNEGLLYYEWTVSGKGVNSTETTDNDYYAYFPSAGTYSVKIAGKDSKTHKVIVTDSTTVTIRLK